MTRYQRLLVGMNLTEADRARSRYAEMFTRMCGAREVHFLHVREEQDLPPDIQEAYPQIRQGEKESARQHMQDNACGVFSAPEGVLVSCEVVEGSLLEEIIGHVRDLDIDLVLMGRRSGEQEQGVLAEKLARKAPCSVLFLPEDAPEAVSRILVAVDFSNHARAALEAAVELAVARGHQEILCLHVYQVPLGYSHTGKSLVEFEEILRQNAEEQYREMIAKIDARGIDLRFLLACGDQPSRVIRDQIFNHHVDLAVVGARGRTTGAAILLGSVTERLIRITPCPLLAVKQKGEGMGILEALFKV